MSTAIKLRSKMPEGANLVYGCLLCLCLLFFALFFIYAGTCPEKQLPNMSSWRKLILLPSWYEAVSNFVFHGWTHKDLWTSTRVIQNLCLYLECFWRQQRYTFKVEIKNSQYISTVDIKNVLCRFIII